MFQGDVFGTIEGEVTLITEAEELLQSGRAATGGVGVGEEERMSYKQDRQFMYKKKHEYS